MKTNVNIYAFRNAFEQHGRSEQFSYDGLSVLFDYMEQYEEDTGEEMELDVVALCCDFAEDTVQGIADNYSIDLSECEDDDEKADAVRSYLEENTMLCGETDAGFVYQQF